MAYADLSIFIFNYRFYKNFKDLFTKYMYLDYNSIKKYFFNLFTLHYWLDNIFLLLLLPIFYLILILSKTLHIFIICKILFYILKYVLKYIFYFIDLLFFLIFKNLNLKNKYIKSIFRFLYKFTIKLLYKIYRFIFFILPYIIHLKDFYFILKDFQLSIILFLHRILDVIEWIPRSYSYYLLRRYIFLFELSLKSFYKHLSYKYEIRHIIIESFKTNIKNTILDIISNIYLLPYYLKYIFFVSKHYFYYYYTSFFPFIYLFIKTLPTNLLIIKYHIISLYSSFYYTISMFYYIDIDYYLLISPLLKTIKYIYNFFSFPFFLIFNIIFIIIRLLKTIIIRIYKLFKFE